MKLDYPFLIYPEINGINNFSHVFLVDRELPNYHKFLNLSKKQIYPIIYSTFSSKINLLNLFSENFMYIKTLTLCFNSLASENPPVFLDGEPLFFNKELETDYTNNNIIYSNNLIFLLNLINTFNIQRIDFLISDSFNYTNWVKYYNLLKKKTGITIGVSSEKNVNFDGTLTIKYEYQNISPTYSTENVQTNKLSLSITDFITITSSGSYTLTTSDNNYILKFDEDTVGYFNYDDISVNCIIVGGGGGGGADNFEAGGGGGGGGGITTDSFTSVANNIFTITIGSGGAGISDVDNSVMGNNGNSSSIYYNDITYTALGGYYGSNAGGDGSGGGDGGDSGGYNYNGSVVSGGSGGSGGDLGEDGSNGTNGGGGGGGGYDGGGDDYEIYSDNAGGDGSIINAGYSVYYYGTQFGAGGGGGSSRYASESSIGDGGNAYAGNGGNVNIVYDGVQGNGFSATSGYGGGGGGAGAGNDGTRTSGSGGSGTVVLYFSMDEPTTTTTDTTTTTTDTTTSISNICFSSKTPIQTDQGIFHISKINPKIHTINNKKIVAITKSITQDKHLVRIGKDAFSLNYPNKDIILTKKHNIYFKGKMMEAHKFIGHYDKITLVRYNGETLYNILMEKYDVVKVNNILCETLHPENIIAKLYTSYISDDYKNKITIAINDCIKKNDYDSYKKIERRLNKELEHVKDNVF
jgi:hypothetical protein